MIRLAALLRKEGAFPIATAGFLNFSQPTFMDAVARCVAKGAAAIYVQPYFLISGYYVTNGIPKLLQDARAAYPQTNFYLAPAFDFHSALVTLTHTRAQEADPEADALLLMAHGSPHEAANTPIFHVNQALEPHYSQVRLGFMEVNTPSITDAAAQLLEAGTNRIVAVPYFLQLGGHVAEDLPNTIAEIQAGTPECTVTLADYLSYDSRLLEVVRDRLSTARPFQ